MPGAEGEKGGGLLGELSGTVSHCYYGNVSYPQVRQSESQYLRRIFYHPV